MAWNNYNNRGGWNNNRGYNNNRGNFFNNRGGYPPQGPGPNGPWQDRGQYPDQGQGGYAPSPNPDCPYAIGEMVLHRATNTEMSVIRIGREQVQCRLPDMRAEWFYVEELVSASDITDDKK